MMDKGQLSNGCENKLKERMEMLRYTLEVRKSFRAHITF